MNLEELAHMSVQFARAFQIFYLKSLIVMKTILLKFTFPIVLNTFCSNSHLSAKFFARRLFRNRNRVCFPTLSSDLPGAEIFFPNVCGEILMQQRVCAPTLELSQTCLELLDGLSHHVQSKVWVGVLVDLLKLMGQSIPCAHRDWTSTTTDWKALAL